MNSFVAPMKPVLYDLPAPVNLSSGWNYGSMLGACLGVQIVTGLLLSMHYSPDIDQAFSSVIHIMRDVHQGWLIRSIHMNGATMFFFCMYLHIARGIYFLSFFKKRTWWVGSAIFLLAMGIAFTGYVLPWGQMSYWGATVITNLLGVVPRVGQSLVDWLWGGYGIGNASLKRFFVFHFAAPFALAGLVGIHLVFLHETGSSNPLGGNSSVEAVPFHIYYTWKDLVGIFLILGVEFWVSYHSPEMFSEPLNCFPADPLNTPLHIQPEWYFLFAYTILRSLPTKESGVLALAASIFVLFLMPYYPRPLWMGIQYNFYAQGLYWLFMANFVLLTYLGTCPIESPYVEMGYWSSVSYFVFFIVYPLSWFFWERVTFKSS